MYTFRLDYNRILSSKKKKKRNLDGIREPPSLVEAFINNWELSSKIALSTPTSSANCKALAPTRASIFSAQ